MNVNPHELAAMADTLRAHGYVVSVPVYRPWTTAEIARLRALYPTASVAEIARQLNRTVPAVFARAHRLKLERPNGTRKSWTPQENAFLREHAATMCLAELADALGRSASSVYNHALWLGLRLMRAPKAEQSTTEVRSSGSQGIRSVTIHRL